MSVIFLLVIIGVVVAGLFLAGFIWAVKSGQYDDTYTPSVRMLFEDSQSVQKENNSSSEKPEEKDLKTDVDQHKLK